MSLARTSCAATLLAASLPMHAFAANAAEDRWLVKFGAHDVDPKSDNGRLANGALAVDVGSSTRPSATLEYLFSPNVGIEAIVAWPFEHTIKLNGADAAKVKQLPPTVTLHYHFNPGGTLSPFIGVGVNYTRFFSAKERGPLAGAQLNLDDSFGLAAHVGLDVRINDNWSAGFDVRWIDIDTEARVNGAKVGTAQIDPLVGGVFVGYKF